MQLSAEQLRKIAPECVHPESWLSPLESAMNEFLIYNNFRAAAFLAHVAVESDGFNRLRENLYYSSASRLCQVWPKRFPTIEVAAPYMRNPQKLANFVYANRLGNGSEQSNDGYRFRGGGLIMTTGRLNYSVTGSMIGVDLVANPDKLEDKNTAARAAGYFWWSHDLNQLADGIPGVSEDEDFLRETEIINGGRTGLADRRARFMRALACLESSGLTPRNR